MSASTPAHPQTRIVVIAEHVLLRESLELALAASGYVVPSLPALPGPQPLATTIAEITGVRPDLALLDIDAGSYGDGLRLVAPLARNGIKVVAMTSTTSGDRWSDAVRYGAAKVHSRALPLAAVLTTVHRLVADLPVMGPQERDDLVAQGEHGREQRRETLSRLDSLTAREAAVLGGLLDGLAVRAIAERSGVSEATIRTQVRAILIKLDVTSQVGAVGRAHDVGWRPPTPAPGRG